MKACEGRIGRVFVLRLEDGDVVPGCIEAFAAEKEIRAGQVTLVGGVGGGEVVVGPRDSVAMPPQPVLVPVDGAHEVVGVGVLAPGEDGKPILHMHGALGRSGKTMTGCLRPGVDHVAYRRGNRPGTSRCGQRSDARTERAASRCWKFGRLASRAPDCRRSSAI